MSYHFAALHQAAAAAVFVHHLVLFLTAQSFHSMLYFVLGLLPLIPSNLIYHYHTTVVAVAVHNHHQHHVVHYCHYYYHYHRHHP